MADFGKETVVFLEVDMPFCSLTYGVAPCPAVLGVDSTSKCYNTRATCPVPASYDGDSRTAGKYVTLRFVRGQDGIAQYGPVIPSMADDPRTTPALVNLGGMDKNMGALGQRETVSVTLDDHRSSDNQVDKYRLERKSGAASSTGATYDPYTQGTFWGKFFARNPYLVGYPCRIRQGFAGDALADMRVRSYVLDKFEGPAGGQVKMALKDVFSLIESRKAVAPAASSGELQADILAAAGAATLSPVGIGNTEYSAAGYLCIGDEIIAFTRVADALTLTTRGALGTTAADHKAQDVVQLVLQYSAQLAKDIIYDLLTNYSGVPAANIPLATWTTDLAALSDLYTRTIPQPTSLLDLIGSLCEVAGITPIPDVETGNIGLVALRASASTATVTDDGWLVDGSFTVRRQDIKRVSQVWVFYGQRDPTKGIEEESNYHSRLIQDDTAAEGPQQYGVPAIRKVFGAWIPQFGRSLALSAGDRIMAVFRDAPDEAQFSLVASRDGELSLALPFMLEAAEVQDETGAVTSVQHVPVSLSREENEIKVQSQKVVFSGADSGGGTTRTIYIENNALNLDLRTIHDSLYAVPTGVETVTFIVQPGITVGSAFTSAAALTTGNWPAGVVLSITNQGTIQGASGDGGYGGDDATPVGGNGTNGGDALSVTFAVSVNNTSGQIWAGGGGGGGGGKGIGGAFKCGGGGAGSGAGTLVGTPGAALTTNVVPGAAGSSGTATAGGAHGTGGRVLGAGGGDGGDGGGPGLDGVAGSAGSAGSAGGSPGTAGHYIVGNSLVTWTAVGDRRGNVA